MSGPSSVVRLNGENWRDCAIRYGLRWGLGVEVGKYFDEEIAIGANEENAAWMAGMIVLMIPKQLWNDRRALGRLRRSRYLGLDRRSVPCRRRASGLDAHTARFCFADPGSAISAPYFSIKFCFRYWPMY